MVNYFWEKTYRVKELRAENGSCPNLWIKSLKKMEVVRGSQQLFEQRRTQRRKSVCPEAASLTCTPDVTRSQVYRPENCKQSKDKTGVES